MPISRPMSRLDRLRCATRNAHALIEAVPALSRLVAADLTHDVYVSVLQHLEAFHACIEPAIACALTGLRSALVLLDGSRPQALAEDLAWFGVRPLPSPPIPMPDTPAGALGMLYVVEGSGLGGRVIGRHLTDSLGVCPGQGGSFYCRRDAETVRWRWRHLCQVLEGPLPGDAPEGRLIEGAQVTFRFLDRWLRTIEIVPGMTAAAAP